MVCCMQLRTTSIAWGQEARLHCEERGNEHQGLHGVRERGGMLECRYSTDSPNRPPQLDVSAPTNHGHTKAFR